MQFKLSVLGWSLIAVSLGAAAPLPVGRAFYLQVEAPMPGAVPDAAGRPRYPMVCQVLRGPPSNAVDKIFVESACRPSNGQMLTRWDPARQRMVPAPDVKAEPPFVSPARILSLRAWAPAEAFADGPERSGANDYEVVLKGREPGSKRSRVMLRSGNWLRMDDVGWDGRTSLNVENPDIGVALSTHHDNQTRVLAIRGPNPRAPFQPPPPPPSLPKAPGLQVLGETCTWRDLWPGMYDAGLWECRAADGVPLAQRLFSKGSLGEDIIAVEVHRGRVPLSRVLPSRSEVSAKLLGLAN